MHLRDLSPASFRGVAFLCPNDTTEEGRQSIEHHYPDANFRYVEDNGLIPPKFKITAILHGDNLPAKVRALRNALNTPGPGTLKHPYYGSNNCAVIGPYHVSRKDEDSGVITFEINFAVTGPAIFPGLAAMIPAVISGLAASVISDIKNLMPEAYGAGPLSDVSRTVIAQGITTVGSALQSQFAAATTVPARLVAAAPNLASDATALAGFIASSAIAAVESDASVISGENLVSGFKAVFDSAGTVVADAARIT